VELVCPAGNLPSLKAAADNGADAVCMGLRDDTNARHFPGLNFDEKRARQGIEYARTRGRKVFMAINTYPQPAGWKRWERATADGTGAGGFRRLPGWRGRPGHGLGLFRTTRPTGLRRRLLARPGGHDPQSIARIRNSMKTTPKRPQLPRFLARPLGLVPGRVHGSLSARLLERVFAEQRADGELDFMEGKSIRIRVLDAGIDLSLSAGTNGFESRSLEDATDLIIEGTTYDFLLLIAGREDPDTLFFQRRLRMSGDTALGVHLKNFLASVDLDSLPLATPSCAPVWTGGYTCMSAFWDRLGPEVCCSESYDRTCIAPRQPFVTAAPVSLHASATQCVGW